MAESTFPIILFPLEFSSKETTLSQGIIKGSSKPPTFQHSKSKRLFSLPMSHLAASFFFFFSLALLSLARAQGRAPHGLAYESPMAFSPSAFAFFHPNGQQAGTQNPCAASNCSPLPMAAQVEASAVHQSKGSSRGMGAGGVAGIVFGFVFAVLLAMGVYYVVVTRRANVARAKSVVQPDA